MYPPPPPPPPHLDHLYFLKRVKITPIFLPDASTNERITGTNFLKELKIQMCSTDVIRRMRQKM
jgi:hypothetical protein